MNNKMYNRAALSTAITFGSSARDPLISPAVFSHDRPVMWHGPRSTISGNRRASVGQWPRPPAEGEQSASADSPAVARRDREVA